MAIPGTVHRGRTMRMGRGKDLSNGETMERTGDTLAAEDARKLQTVIMGAGPAGLTAAWELTHKEVPVTILEADPTALGGIARTAAYKGFRFDIGGHRFFTKSDEIQELWHQILADEDWLTVPRLSRIYYRGRFFLYPLKPFDALGNLGLLETGRCLSSYARSRLFPRKQESSFEDWVANRFGDRLYRIFFKTYTEKVWGIACTDISADWAAQRIKGLSLLSSIRNALSVYKKTQDGNVIKTLINEFEYPKLGPGMMWTKAAEQIQALGALLHRGATVVGLHHHGGRLTHVEAEVGGGREVFQASHFISTLPIRDLVNMVDPAPPPGVLRAANSLSYRDFITVVLIVNAESLFPDNWIYVHDSSVRLGRVQNFKNWSPHMVPDPSKTSLGLEYFCTEGDDLWQMSDSELVELGTREVAKLGLCRADEIEDATALRMRKCYPVYDGSYQEHVATVRSYVESVMPNLQLVGRNGMHKYNNQDHSMMTALLAARRILGETRDPWNVNTDAEYHEDIRSDHDSAARKVPVAVSKT